MTEFESTIKCEHSFPLGFQYYYTRDSIDFLIHRKLGITQSPLSLIRKSERMFVIFLLISLLYNVIWQVEWNLDSHPSLSVSNNTGCPNHVVSLVTLNNVVIFWHFTEVFQILSTSQKLVIQFVNMFVLLWKCLRGNTLCEKPLFIRVQSD